MNTPFFLATLTSCQEAWRADKLPYVVFKTKGVPQGSILEPMLFLLFVNDLSDVVQHCTVNLYADNTTIYSTDENPVVLGARMEKDLESVANWIKMNDLKMNVVKTQLMVLTRKGKYHMADDLELIIGNTCLVKQNCGSKD